MEDEKIRVRYISRHTHNILNAEESTVQIARTGVFLCTHGSGLISLNGEKMVIEPKSLLVYFPYSTLRIHRRSEDLEGIIISCNLEGIQPLLYKVSDFNGLFLIRHNPYTQINDEQLRHLSLHIELVHNTWQKIVKEQEAKVDNNNRPIRDIYDQQLELLSNSLMLEIVSCYARFVPTNLMINRKDSVLQKFISSLYKNFREEHEVRFYSEEQCLTSRYFSAIIKEKTGKAPSEWIAVALLSESKRLLSTTNKSIKDISEELNFPNQSYFGKWFKNLTNISPLEFKQTHKGTNCDSDIDDFMQLIARGR